MLWVCAQHLASGMLPGKYGPHGELVFFLIKKEPLAFTKAVVFETFCSCGDAQGMCFDWSAPDGRRKCIWIKRWSVSRLRRHVEIGLPKKPGLGQ